MKTRMITCAIALLMSATAGADIAQPDAIVFGTLSIDGQGVDTNSAYTVIARVAGFDDPVSVYRMGDHPAAGTRYVLHFPHAVQADGKTPSSDSPQAGALAKIHVRHNTDGSEVVVASVNVPVSGNAQQLDLRVAAKDLDAGYALNDSSSSGCSSEGGMCGAVSVISPLLMLCGLVRMRQRIRR